MRNFIVKTLLLLTQNDTRNNTKQSNTVNCW